MLARHAMWTRVAQGSIVMRMVKSPDWPVDRLKALIDRTLDGTGLNYTKIAALAGINPSQISRWINGTSRPKPETLAALGKAIQERYPGLKIGPDELVDAVYPRDTAAGTDDIERAQESGTPSDGAAASPNTSPSPTEEALLAALTAVQEELRLLREQVTALSERSEPNRDIPHQRGA